MTFPFAKDFFAYAVKREKIRIAKDAGQERPWTDDEILQTYRFCNVFREDDVVTKWIRENLRDPMTNDGMVLMVMVVARFFNRVTTLEKIKDILLTQGFNAYLFRERLKDHAPLVTGAYMIKTPKGMNKLEGLLEIFQPVYNDLKHLDNFVSCRGPFLEDLWMELKKYPYIGNFIAYEVVTDMRHTKLMEGVQDANSWACAGPGAARGMSRICFGEIGNFRYSSDSDQTRLNNGMQQLLMFSRSQEYWPFKRHWEMREVEHTLCEFDKYERVRRHEGTPKQKYTPACT